MNVAAAPAATPVDRAIAYHERTKHSLKRYAAGPETLDWDGQPDPFRTFAGAARTPLPLLADGLDTPFGDLFVPGKVAPAPLTLASVATLLELSVGLTAWKEFGPDRWAVRANPSSGNLHPTETYVVAQNVPALPGGLHHYVSRDHVLELRCPLAADGPARLWIGLSSIHWREAWKYGERAFRYCQLDTGHALAALRYGAAALGWRAQVVPGLGSAALAALLGLDRDGDFAGAEREEPELLIAIAAEPGAAYAPDMLPGLDGAGWAGTANVLDRHPMYRWPVIEEVAQATRVPGGVAAPALAPPPAYPPRAVPATARAADVILGRRSAQRFEAKFHMPRETFWSMLDALLPRTAPPFDAWDLAPALHPILFVHKVEGVESGVYALPRRPEVGERLRAALREDFEWIRPEGCPDHLPLFRLARTDARGVIRTLSCHQAIAGDSCFSLGLLATFDEALAEGAWRYRQLFQEAGMLGQVLYLEAEAAGLRGTGIGCYFDDDVHRLLGLDGRQFQSMYHFTVGRPVADARIVSSPAYPGRTA
ncbi:SagB/ThcOx family dehydrogenase [Xanthobacter sediminis]